MDHATGPLDIDDARSAVDWWVTAGVDTLIEEEPRDWLAAPKPAAKTPATAQVATPSALPADLQALRRHYETQPDLPFAGPGTTRILPVGNPASGLMLLADMPTSEDAMAGQIFSGDCGLLFDRMLAAIGRDRGSVYLTTLSCLAAPGGRLDAETASACGALARHHVALAAPKRLLLLGEAAIKVMTGLALPAARGRLLPIEIEGTRVNAVATYHPRYLLQRPAAKAGAWADLQRLVEGF